MQSSSPYALKCYLQLTELTDTGSVDLLLDKSDRVQGDLILSVQKKIEAYKH